MTAEKTHELRELLQIIQILDNEYETVARPAIIQLREYAEERMSELLSGSAKQSKPVEIPIEIQELRSIKYQVGKDNSEYISVSRVSQRVIDFLKSKNHKIEDEGWNYTLTDKWLSRRKK